MAPRTPLFAPHQYFKSTQSPLIYGVFVFSGYVIGSVLAVWLIAFWLLDSVENPPVGINRELFSLVPLLFVVTVLFGIAALLLIAAVMHYFLPTKHSGTFGQAVAVAAWAYAPNLVSLPIQVGWGWYQIRDVTFDTDDPARFAEKAEAYVDSLSTVPDLVLTVAVIGWSVWILTDGIRATHEVDRSDAIIPALIVGGGSLVLAIFF